MIDKTPKKEIIGLNLVILVPQTASLPSPVKRTSCQIQILTSRVPPP